jgi:SAM-dependent methyltransferase
MSNFEQSEDYVKDLKRKIKKEAGKMSGSKIEERDTLSEGDLSGSNTGTRDKSVYDFLSSAEQNSRIGVKMPSLEKLSFLRKAAYKGIIRFLYKVLRVITLNQNQFNSSMLDILRNLSGTIYDFELKTSNDNTRFNAKLTDNYVQLKNLESKIYYMEKNIDYLKNNIIQLNQKMDSLPAAGNDKAGEVINSKIIRINEITGDIEKNNSDTDSLYVFLEDNLRGSREEIKERLKIYLPFIEKAGIGFKDSPVLDIGCGRGEWLQLLKEKNINAMGVDINKIMVSTCRDIGLNVIKEEALSYLKTIKDSSIGAVTGFHIIEHYGFDHLILLFKELYRILKPGGLVIFETPNPGNILVGSCTFYLDPTHNKPLPSLLVKLLLESRGFGKINIINLHPNKVHSGLMDDASTNLAILNDYFFGPQDYGIMGYKE